VPLSYAPPLVDPTHLALMTTVVLYVWPAVLVGIVALVRWTRLRQRPAFLVLGYLTCTGIELFARSIGYTFAWARYIGAVQQDRILVAFVNASLTLSAASVVLSVLPVIWLARICEQPKSQSPNPRLERP
jgi:hypothetical protein